MTRPITRPLALPYKLGLLGTLYFAQGLPYGFFFQAMPVLLRKRGASLGQVGLLALVALPWALKFAWAPLVDRVYSVRVGRRRSWILPLQLAAAAVLVALALLPTERTLPLVAGAFVLNLVAATQDIATDGLAVDVLAPHERGFANGLQVAGYRAGMVVGGGALLILHDRLGSTNTFLTMALLVVLSTIPVALAPEPQIARTVTGTPPLHFLRRPGVGPILALVFVYKAGEAFAGGMLRPLLVDRGLSLADIGWLLGTVGFVAGLLGALAGGALVNRMGRYPALLAFAALQAAIVASSVYLAASTPGRPVLYAFCGLEHFISGMATAALFTCMMDWSRPAASGTDYTVQASTVVISTVLGYALSGVSAQTLGYTAHFALATALTVGAVAAVWSWFPREGASW